ncbi:MAG: hypothetical protein JNG86_02675 [Verrucomicrobiaceae bacterium]|nr:hypothetical protein [Verrucomicrobiaceae bacterium]
MKTHLFLLLALAFSTTLAMAERQVLFFGKETKKDSTHIALSIEEDGKVYGTEAWIAREEHSALGTLDGIVNGGVIQVLYSYTVEGSEQSEEQVLKIDGDTLYIGEGELVEAGNGRMNLKEPNKVAFPKTKALKRIPVTEPKAGSPGRKAIMDAMRGPVSKKAGKAVTFTGKVLMTGGWARFHGNVATTDGTPPKNEDVAAEMELDFVALLKKNDDGSWKVVTSGFAGDTGVLDEARENHPEAPWPLFEWVD